MIEPIEPSRAAGARTLPGRLGLLAVAGILAPGPASADTVGFQPYVRAALVHEGTDDTAFGDRRCHPAEVAEYFGCVPGEDGRPLGAYGDFGSSLGGELAAGISAEAWRIELALAHQPDFSFEGNANFLAAGAEQPVAADVRHSRLGVQFYSNLGALFGGSLGRFEPYLGFGAAAARNRVDDMVYEFPELADQPRYTSVPGATYTSMGWSAELGTGFRLGVDRVLDLGLAYRDHGRILTARDDIEVYSGGDLLAEVAVERTQAQLRTWGLVLSLRQHF